MSPAELIAAREALDWSRITLARRLETTEATIRQMEAGKRSIPPSVAKWLAGWLAYEAKHPGATDWRVKPQAAA